MVLRVSHDEDSLPGSGTRYLKGILIEETICPSIIVLKFAVSAVVRYERTVFRERRDEALDVVNTDILRYEICALKTSVQGMIPPPGRREYQDATRHSDESLRMGPEKKVVAGHDLSVF